MASYATMGSPPEIGFHRELHGLRIRVEEDGVTATKINSHNNYAHGVAISERPLFGHAHFEVEIRDHGTPWSGSFKIGVMEVPAGADNFEVPRYSPQNENTWVWTANQLFARQETREWGKLDIESLGKGDRLAFHILPNGTLFFYVNGRCLGEGFRNLYSPDKDLFALVDVYGKGRQLTIVRSYCVPSNLLSLCCMVIARSLPDEDKQEHLDTLPLPKPVKGLIASFF